MPPVLTTSPMFEDFAKVLLGTGNAEDVVWLGSDGPKTIRAIVRQKVQSPEIGQGSFDTRTPLNTIRVAPADVQGITDDDSFTVRGETFRVARSGIKPDGVALVAVDLETTPR